jgi:hypothetical protein
MAYNHVVLSGTNAPTTLSFSMDQLKKASSFACNIVNFNDVLGQLVIYNAAAMNMASNDYNVEVNLNDGSKVIFNNAIYNAQWDRLEFLNSDEFKPAIELPNVSTIIFTKV